MRSLLIKAVLIVCMVAAGNCCLLAQDFRVESKVLVGKETEPHSTNVTLFRGPHIYDFLDKPEQITLYDLERGRIVVVDPVNLKKAEVSVGLLDSYCQTLLLKPTGNDAFLKFLLRPDLAVTEDQKSGETIFAGQYLTYRVLGVKPEQSGTEKRYREFADLSARLNALVNQRSLPPFARLAVNSSLAEAGKIPSKIHLTIPSRRLIGRALELHSEHEFRARILDSETAKIEAAGETMARCELVKLSDFVRATNAEADKKAE
ncbi:MAG: hypothetical protein SGJ20_00530 [Planctomycetota bacterium]|nr:hypothetical protein [Planctomycetota bacterium]